MPWNEELQVEVTLTHEAAAFAATLALEGMGGAPARADGKLVRVPVAARSGAVMETARRLNRAGVAAEDIVVRAAERAAQRLGLAV